MDFSGALEEMRYANQKVRRASWPALGALRALAAFPDANGNMRIWAVDTEGTFSWLPGASDLFADDWEIAK